MASMTTTTVADRIGHVYQWYNDTITKHERRIWIVSWFICGMLTILLPFPIVRHITSQRVTGTNIYDDDGDNNNNNNNNNGEDNNDDRRDEGWTPPILLIAIYLCSILVFIGILFLGYHSLQTGRSTSGGRYMDNNSYFTIYVALILFACYDGVLLVLFIFYIVSSYDEEEHGFVGGQFGGVMYFTCVLWFLFSMTFAVLLLLKGKHPIGTDPLEYVSQTSVSDYHEMKNSTNNDKNNDNKKENEQQPTLTTV